MMRPHASVACLLLCCSAAPVWAGQVTVENAALRRVLTTDAGKWRTERVESLLTGDELPARSVEFRMTLESWPERRPVADLTAADFRRRGEVETDGQDLVVALHNEQYKVAVRVHYEAPANVWWHRKWIEISGPESLFVAELVVEALEMQEEVRTEAFPGLGQPVYLARQFFCGVEHPGSQNTVDGRSVSCGYRPAMRLSAEWQRSKPCVLGVAPDQPLRRVRDEFLRYVSHHRPQKLRPFLLWESWMTNTRPTDAVCAELAKQLKSDYADRGVRLDCFLLSAWWEDMQSIWKPHPDSFPKGLGPTVATVKRALGAPTGLWFPLAGGKLDRHWGAKQGYELIHLDPKKPLAGNYCIGGPKYYREYKRTLVNLVRRHQIAALKMDFVNFRCNRTDHGHLPGSDSVVKLMDNYLDVMAAVRAANPDIVVYPTTGINQSPWWLFHVDAVWRGGADLYVPHEPTPPVPHCRALVTTYVDHVLHQQFRERHKQYPLSSLMDHGVLTAPSRGYLGRLGTPTGDPLINFCHDAVLYVLRGSFLRELYVPPASLTDDYKDLLAAVLRWSQTPVVNDVVFADTRQVLGDPDQLEVYGYAHFTPQNRGIIVLRNPSLETQPAKLTLDEVAGMRPDSRRHQVRVIYPYRRVLTSDGQYGSNLEIELEGLEVLVLEILAASEAGAWPVGCRFAAEAGATTCQTWGQAGTAAQVELGGEHRSLSFPGERQAPSVGAAKWHATDGRAVLDLKMKVPPRVTDVRLWLDLRFPSDRSENGKLEAKVTVNGKPAPVHIRMAPPWPWCYIEAALLGSGDLTVRAELWRAAMTPRRATARTLLRYTEQLIAGERLPAKSERAKTATPELTQRWAQECRPTVVLAPATDLALSAGPGAFASSHDGRYPPSFAFDSDRRSFWCSRGKRNEWLVRRFASERSIAGARVTWFGAWKVKRYRVDAWTADGWKTVATRENANSGTGPLTTRDAFAPVHTTAVRFFIESVHAPSVNTAIRNIELLPMDRPAP